MKVREAQIQDLEIVVEESTEPANIVVKVIKPGKQPPIEKK
jgi:hypothetical protein